MPDSDERDNLRVDIRNLTTAVQQNAKATSDLTITLALNEERRQVAARELAELQVGVNKDRDDLREWKKNEFYALRDDIKQATAQVAVETAKATAQVASETAKATAQVATETAKTTAAVLVKASEIHGTLDGRIASLEKFLNWRILLLVVISVALLGGLAGGLGREVCVILFKKVTGL